jgi:hypothetical protein
MDVEVHYSATATPRANGQAERFDLVEVGAYGRLVRRILYSAETGRFLYAETGCFLYSAETGCLLYAEYGAGLLSVEPVFLL